jgi:hypothetical protein
VTNQNLVLPTDYAAWLVSLKQRIAGTRQRAALVVSRQPVEAQLQKQQALRTPGDERA